MVCPMAKINHCEECGYEDDYDAKGYRSVGKGQHVEAAGSGHVIRAERPHACDLPKAYLYEEGDVFVCQCGARRKLVLGETWSDPRDGSSGQLKKWEAA